MAKKKSYWSHLPKSSGLGKLSKKSKKAVSKRKRKTIRLRKPAVKRPVAAKVKEKKPEVKKWVFWGSRQTLEAKDSVVASLKRQGYKVRVDGTGQGYKIYTWGKASYHS